jgi:protein phosphatase
MYIGHVGDSRAYRLRSGQIQQMTRDHSLVNDYLMAMPELTEEQRSELPKNVITRALGMQDQVMVDLQSDDAEPGDVYLLCSDGLSGMIDDSEILDVLRGSQDLEAVCKRLVALANEHGGEDNITALVVRIDPDTEAEPKPLADTLPLVNPGPDLALTDADTPPASAAAPKPDA